MTQGSSTFIKSWLVMAMLWNAAPTQAAVVSLTNLTWSGVGTYGTSAGGTDMSASPVSTAKFAYVSTFEGVNNVSPLNIDNNKVGTQTNGSRVISSTFNADGGDNLNLYFNYISTDGRKYIDYAWARLLDANNQHIDWLFAAQSTNSNNGQVVPGKFLNDQVKPDAFPADIGAVINSGNTLGFEEGGTNWQALGDSSGTCWDSANTCGSTGWVLSQYLFQNTGSYKIEFGVTNWGDTLYDSALAIDYNGLNNFGQSVSSVPAPPSNVLFATGLLMLMTYCRQRKLLSR